MSTHKSTYPLPIIGTGGTVTTLGNTNRIRILISGRVTIRGLAGVTRRGNCNSDTRGLTRQRCYIQFAINSTSTTTRRPTIYAPSTHASAIITVTTSAVNRKTRRLNGALLGTFIFSLARRRGLPEAVLFCGNNTRLAYRNSPVLRSLGILRTRNIRVLAYNAYLGFCNLARGLHVNAIAGVCIVTRGVLGTKGIIGP